MTLLIHVIQLSFRNYKGNFTGLRVFGFVRIHRPAGFHLAMSIFVNIDAICVSNVKTRDFSVLKISMQRNSRITSLASRLQNDKRTDMLHAGVEFSRSLNEMIHLPVIRSLRRPRQL